jgi:cytoskeletal protein RodZ
MYRRAVEMTEGMSKRFLSAAMLLLPTIAILLAVLVWQLLRANDELSRISSDLSNASSHTNRLANDVERVRAEIVAIRSATPCDISQDTPIGEALARREPDCP